jgi:hypothetical protein
MKKNLSNLFTILFILFLWSCKTEDPVFEQTANERVNAALDSYQKQLTGSEYGWKATIYPGAGSVYSFYFKFNDQNRVVMYSDFNQESAITSKESSYQVKALQVPSLVFDTYSYLHVLADPDAAVNDGDYGLGLQSDFEFSFNTDTSNDGSITLTGTKNRTRLVLTKATQVEAAAYRAGGLGKSLLFNNIDLYPVYFKRVTLAGVTYEINVNTSLRTIMLTWLEGTTTKRFTTSFYYTSTGVVFSNALVNGSTSLSGFDNIVWDEVKKQLTVSVGNSALAVNGASKPLSVDIAAARRWWNDPLPSGGEWRSENGFTVNGVQNALGVDKLDANGNPYVVYLFIPGGPGYYDLLAPAFRMENSLGIAYVNVIESTFAADGRAVFREVRTAGEPTPPTSGPFVETRKLLTESTGYYLIQTSEKTYDMVNAKDATVWINWFRI